MNKMTCSKCGRLIPEDAVFCPDCGAAIFRSASAVPSAPPPPEPAPQEQPPEEPRKSLPYQKLIPPAAVALALVLALALSWNTLAGIFSPDDDPQLSTAPSTEATTPSAESTAPSTETTAPPQTTPSETTPISTEPDLSWYVEDLNYMSHEDFFAVERTLAQTLRPLVWTDSHGVDCVLTDHDGLQIFRDGKYIFRVPNIEALDPGVALVSADGQYAYLRDDTRLFRISLLTGETETLFTFDNIIRLTQPFREMYYIAAEMNDTISLCRVYLPTATLDVLYDGIPARTPLNWLSIIFPTGNYGTIFWEGISPEMVDALYAEFSNPDSKYYPNFGDKYNDLSAFWENPEQMRQLYRSGQAGEPMIKLQEDKNLQALWKGTYNISDGTVTQDWGVVDTCWFGSGYSHDHYNPELTADIEPTILNKEALPVPGMAPPPSEMAESIRKETYSDANKLYKVEDIRNGNQPILMYQSGGYRSISNLPYVKKGIHPINCKYYTYYPSVDNTLIRLDLRGNASVIYTAKHGELEQLCYSQGNLFFLDGGTIVMLDTVACTSRELLTHPGHIWMYYEEESKLYVTTTLGLAIHAYLFDYTTGVLEETSYRL